jgi:hypothetical protein
MGSQLFKPLVKVMVQPLFVVIDKDTGRDMHSVYQAQSFLNT